MANGGFNPGQGSVAEYQVSSVPWVTSSTISGIVQYTWPSLSRFFVIKNSSGSNSIKVGFTNLGIVSSSNNFPVGANESFTGDFRLKTLFVSGSGNTIALIVGLTGIPTTAMTPITGSNGYTGVG